MPFASVSRYVYFATDPVGGDEPVRVGGRFVI
jgi:hypothetical protein